MSDINSSIEGPATKKAKAEGAGQQALKEEVEKVVNALNKCLDSHDENKKEVLEKLHNMCEEQKKAIDDLEVKITSALETKFREEDRRLWAAMNNLQASISADEARISEALQRAKAELLVLQKYSLNKREGLELKAEKEVTPEWFDQPRGLKVNKVSNAGRIFLSPTRNAEQERVLVKNGLENAIAYKALLQKKGERVGGKEYSLRKEESCFSFAPDFLEAETTYTVKTKAKLQEKESEWSEEVVFTTPQFSECCGWKECPDNVVWKNKYSVDEKNPRVATKIIHGREDYCSYGKGYSTIIGNTAIPLNKVTSCSVKTLKSDDGCQIYIGVAPSDINQNKYCNLNKCGWYFSCYDSALCSGPPQNYNNKKYGPRKEEGEYVHDGDSVGVVMDTTKGELSFVMSGVNYGVAFEGIPLDKPLVPCVLLWVEGDSVELIV